MTIDDKARFLDACPHLLDDVQAIDKALGREPMRDWNAVWRDIEDLLRANGSRWKAAERSLFRSVFTQKDPDAEPVLKVLKGKGKDDFEADAELRDFENVPLADDIDDYFEREVRPHVPDAWMDRDKDKDRIRDQLQSPLLPVHAAATSGGDRCGAEGGGGGDRAAVAGGDGVTGGPGHHSPDSGCGARMAAPAPRDRGYPVLVCRSG